MKEVVCIVPATLALRHTEGLFTWARFAWFTELDWLTKIVFQPNIYKTSQRLGPDPISEATVSAVYMTPLQKALKCTEQTSSHLSPTFQFWLLYFL